MNIPPNLIHLKHYLIGDELLDCQHLDMVKHLEDVKQDVPKAELVQHARDILQMWRVHILCEEDVMRTIGYPQVARHARRHAELTGFCLSAIANVERSTVKVFDRNNAIANLQQTMLGHLSKDDQLLIPYIKAYRDRKNETTTPD